MPMQNPVEVAPNMSGIFASHVLVNGTAVVEPMNGAPLPSTVWANPVAGDTITVSYSLDNGVTYTAWSLGAITSDSATKQLAFFSGVTHIKFQRTAGTGTTSTCGVC